MVLLLSLPDESTAFYCGLQWEAHAEELRQQLLRDLTEAQLGEM